MKFNPVQYTVCSRYIIWLVTSVRRLPCPGNPDLEPLLRCSDFLEVEVRARSFLHNQIRRMVGAAQAVATGVISAGDVERMFRNPHPSNWDHRARTAPPQGLYLVNAWGL